MVILVREILLYTLLDHGMDDTDAELWIYMHQMMWDFLAPWSRHWQDQWYASMPSNEGTEIRNKFRRLRDYDAMVPRPTEASVACDRLERYERERTRLGIDTPPRTERSGSWASGWGNGDDWGHPREQLK